MSPPPFPLSGGGCISDDNRAHLARIEKWVRLIGIQQVRPIMKDLLSDSDGTLKEDLKRIYHLSDGSRGSAKIAQHVDVERETVRKRQKTWASMGLLEKDSQTTPYYHTVTLEEVGIEPPEVPSLNEEASNHEPGEDE